MTFLSSESRICLNCHGWMGPAKKENTYKDGKEKNNIGFSQYCNTHPNNWKIFIHNHETLFEKAGP